MNQLNTSGADVARSKMNLVSVSYLYTVSRLSIHRWSNVVPKCFTGCFQRVDGVQSFVEKITFT